MAIRIRRGNQSDFDQNKLLAGELALVLDAGKIYFCYSTGNVKQLTTAEDVQSILDASETSYEALQQLIADLNDNPSELTNILNNISALQSGKLDKTGDSKDNTVTFSVASADSDIASGDTHSTLFGKIAKRFAAIATTLAGKINTADIVQTTATNNTAKVPSSAVTYSLANQLTALNDNLANIGTIYSASGLAVSVPANTETVITGNISLPAGTYVVHFRNNYSGNISIFNSTEGAPIYVQLSDNQATTFFITYACSLCVKFTSPTAYTNSSDGNLCLLRVIRIK